MNNEKIVKFLDRLIKVLFIIVFSLLVLASLKCCQTEIGCDEDYTYSDNIQIEKFEDAFNWTHENLKYNFDKSGQDVQTPEETQRLLTGQCGDWCLITMYLLKKYMDIDSYIVRVKDNIIGGYHSIIRIENDYFQSTSPEVINRFVESGEYEIIDELKYCQAIWEVQDCHCLYTN